MAILPKTLMGKWAVGLIVTFAVLFGIGVIESTVFKQTGGNTLFDNPFLAVPMLAAFLCAIAAFFAATVSFYKQKERSIFVILAAVFGLIILIFLIGEIVFPH